MTDETIIDREQCGMEVLNPDVHHQGHRGQAARTAPAACPAIPSTPPSWWQQLAGAHDLEQAHKRGQLNLL